MGEVLNRQGPTKADRAPALERLHQVTDVHTARLSRKQPPQVHWRAVAAGD